MDNPDKKTIVGRIKEVKIIFDNASTHGIKDGKDVEKDPCPACDEDLYYDEKYSKRIALLDDGHVEGWMCPSCYSQFTPKDKLVKLMSKHKLGKS